MKKLLKGVLKDIKPTKEEEKKIKKKIREFLSRLNKGLKDGKAVLGGSGAKGTWLSKQHDADVFVQYNYKKYKDKSDKLSDILEKDLKKIFSGVKRLHGSRDYFQIRKEDFTFEVVPILKITKAKDAVNITDASPLHARWVNKSKPLADEIRLTKQFCKAIGVYGAESYIKGFSGYMCEILTINYGGFLKLVKKAAKWKPKTVIDFKGYYKNKRDVLFNLNKSKTEGPMVIVDPVDKSRNAAAALGEEKYLKFICICKEFLKNPSKEFFEIKEIKIDDLNKTAGKDKLIVLNIESLKGKEDVVGSKLLKAFEFIDKKLEKKGFKVYSSGWKWDKKKDAKFWFIIDKKKLSMYIEKEGPPKEMKKHVKKFKKKYKRTSVKNGKLYAKVKRKYREPERLVKDLIKKRYVKEKTKKVKLL
ncbi:CCA tRNA nucleotidyltransferase [Candidatus Woesearchaeota archaeon]|nr:CCA tRNA nucleotidyltransferase [Candidatus Woesearchaeota archaeon]